MLPNEFADADESVLHKRFACRPKLISELTKILKCPWGEAVILQGEPTIGKAELVRSGAPTLARDFCCTQQNFDLSHVRIFAAERLLHCYEGT